MHWFTFHSVAHVRFNFWGGLLKKSVILTYNVTRGCTVLSFLSLSLSLSPAKRSHSKCIGLHFILFSMKNIGQSCSGTRFNRLTFVRLSTKLRDTGMDSDIAKWLLVYFLWLNSLLSFFPCILALYLFRVLLLWNICWMALKWFPGD